MAPRTDAERAETRYGPNEEEPVQTAAPEQNPRAALRYSDQAPDANLLDLIFGGGKKEAAPQKGPAGLGTDPSTVGSVPDPGKPYPSEEEGKFAREVGLAYGKSWENFVNGKVARISSKAAKGGVLPRGVFEEGALKGQYSDELAKVALDPQNSALVDLTAKQADFVKKRLGEHFSRAAVAAGRSAISTLGFDPSKVAYDVVSDPTQLAGFQTRQKEGNNAAPAIGVNAASDETLTKDKVPSTVIHESLHRGLKLLTERNEEARKIMDQLPNDEYVVRHLMTSKMGDPEVEPPEWEHRMVRPTQRETAKKLFEGEKGAKFRGMVNRLEDIAAEELVKKHPQGPR